MLQELCVPGMLSDNTRASSGMSRIHELREMNLSIAPSRGSPPGAPTLPVRGAGDQRLGGSRSRVGRAVLVRFSLVGGSSRFAIFGGDATVVDATGSVHVVGARGTFDLADGRSGAGVLLAEGLDGPAGARQGSSAGPMGRCRHDIASLRSASPRPGAYRYWRRYPLDTSALSIASNSRCLAHRHSAE
jgi:hypothetical protein